MKHILALIGGWWIPAVILAACRPSLPPPPVHAGFELSYWIDIDLRLNNGRGYWHPADACLPDSLPSEGHVRNACRALARRYRGDKLYVVYHRQFEWPDARRVWGWWKRYGAEEGLTVVPTVVLENYANPSSLNFTDTEIGEIAGWCLAEMHTDEFGVYDVYIRQQPGSVQDRQMARLKARFGDKLVRLGLQPGEPLNTNCVAGVEDTWTAECQGLTNTWWEEPAPEAGPDLYGRRLLESWAEERRDGESRHIVWDLIPVAWDYDNPPDAYGYVCPGDDALINDPPPAGRLELCHRAIASVYPDGLRTEKFGGYSCDLHILAANSAGKPERPAFYDRLRNDLPYIGYFAPALEQVATIYDRLRRQKAPQAAAGGPVYWVGRESNDLFQTVSANRIPVERFDRLEAAVEAAEPGSGLVVTADGYPEKRTPVSPEVYAAAERKRLRLFIEYPECLPGYRWPDTVCRGRLERGVVTSAFFGDSLPPMAILGINDCTWIPTEAEQTLLAYAKVAGFDRAQFGLTGTRADPLLFREADKLVATTALSDFKTARFGPSASWRCLWEAVLQWLTADTSLRLDRFPVDPVPSYSRDGELPAGARRSAVERGAEWLWKAGLLIHPSWEKERMEAYQPAGGDPNLFFGPPITADLPAGDGCRGVMEGHASSVYRDGSQQYRYFIRADVQGETAFLLGSAARLTGEERYAGTAGKLLDYLFYTSGFRGEARNCRDSASYGLISWANTHPGTFFNDDNARCILGAIGASACLGESRWNRFIVENILANLRTCSRQGFQGNALEQSRIEAHGWRYFYERDLVNPHPHFESWMWACYLWLYDKTHYPLLLDKAKSGIRHMMEAYPDRWLSQNGIQQERARMVLPLAWLVRVDDTPEHREWLDRIVSELLKYQEPCGAIREELGDSRSDKNKILVTSNDAYGRNEAPLIAVNGDPVADLLYTCNFSFFALNEAAHATGDPVYADAVRRLADFLVRAQVRSVAHPDIDGAWFRAFDYGRWDYWASNADNGWGAWCTLTGWIQAWIVATETLVDNGTSYWELTRTVDMEEAMRASLWMMEPIEQNN